MILTSNLTKRASTLILVSILSGLALVYATSENNYKTDNNFLAAISENTFKENGYKADIIINPYSAGIYATENGYKTDFSITPTGIGGRHAESNYQLDLVPERALPDFPTPTTPSTAGGRMPYMN